MKLKKYRLIFGVITGILCVVTLGQIEQSGLDEPALIAPANPALAGIKVLNVVVAIRSTEPGKSGLDGKNLKAKVERMLEKAGIKIFMPGEGVNYNTAISSDLKVSVETLNLIDSQQYVLRVQTSLSRGVRLNEQSNWLFKADVWTTEPVMEAVSVLDIPAKVTEVVLQEAESFIRAYRIANQPKKQVSDANDMTAVSVPAPKESSQQPIKKTAAEYKYAASKNGDVFHTPNCRSAKRISPENLVGYSTREDAINAGKRPCKICKP